MRALVRTSDTDFSGWLDDDVGNLTRVAVATTSAAGNVRVSARFDAESFGAVPMKLNRLELVTSFV